MPDTLTPGEVRCLRLVGEELSNKAIARRLGLSDKTVSNHLTSAYAKLGTSKRREAALIVARDYPNISRLPPIPIAPSTEPPSAQGALGDEAPGGSGAKNARWILPSPPRRPMYLLGIILVFAAVMGLLTIGLVQLTAGGVTTLAAAAPPNAVLALDSPSPSRTK